MKTPKELVRELLLMVGAGEAGDADEIMARSPEQIKRCSEWLAGIQLEAAKHGMTLADEVLAQTIKERLGWYAGCESERVEMHKAIATARDNLKEL